MRNLVRNTHLKSLSVQKQQQKRAYYNISHIHIITNWSPYTLCALTFQWLPVSQKYSLQTYKKTPLTFYFLYTYVLKNKSEKQIGTSMHIFKNFMQKKTKKIWYKSELQIHVTWYLRLSHQFVAEDFQSNLKNKKST